MAVYDLYNSSGLVASNINTGYVLSVIGTDNYYLLVDGVRDSNTDPGTGVPIAILCDIINLTASDSTPAKIKIVFGECVQEIQNFAATDAIPGKIKMSWTEI